MFSRLCFMAGYFLYFLLALNLFLIFFSVIFLIRSFSTTYLSWTVLFVTSFVLLVFILLLKIYCEKKNDKEDNEEIFFVTEV